MITDEGLKQIKYSLDKVYPEYYEEIIDKEMTIIKERRNRVYR